jgi:hypothetical protein
LGDRISCDIKSIATNIQMRERFHAEPVASLDEIMRIHKGEISDIIVESPIILSRNQILEHIQTSHVAFLKCDEEKKSNFLDESSNINDTST